MAAKRWTEEEALEHDGMCPKHEGQVLEVRIDKDLEIGPGKRILYTCPQCVAEETGDEAPTCKTCKAKVKWATTPSGKKMPLDLGFTVVRLENGDWAKAQISHFITCPQAAQHRKDQGQPPEEEVPEPPPPDPGEDTGERRAPDQRPRTGAPWDKCEVCGKATGYRVSDQKPRKDGQPGYVEFENWPCPDGHGHYWKIKGSKYKPQWKASRS